MTKVVKISGLAETSTLTGFFTVGVNSDGESRKADLGFVQEAADNADEKAQRAEDAVSEMEGTYAPLDSPFFQGIPLAPTAPIDDDGQQIANTEFVRLAIDEYAGGGGAAFAPKYIFSSSVGTGLVNVDVLKDVFDGVYPASNETRTLMVVNDNLSTNSVALAVSGFWSSRRYAENAYQTMQLPSGMSSFLVYTFTHLYPPNMSPAILIKAEYYT